MEDEDGQREFTTVKLIRNDIDVNEPWILEEMKYEMDLITLYELNSLLF